MTDDAKERAANEFDRLMGEFAKEAGVEDPMRRPSMDARCSKGKCEQGCYTYCKAARDRKY